MPSSKKPIKNTVKKAIKKPPQKDISSPKPSLNNKPYQDNVEDPQALQHAIKTIPIRDYSHHDVYDEPQTSFDNALYQDSASLLEKTKKQDKSLNENKVKKNKHNEQNHVPLCKIFGVHKAKQEKSLLDQEGELSIGVNFSPPALIENHKEPSFPPQKAAPDKEKASFSSSNTIKGYAKSCADKIKHQINEYSGRNLPDKTIDLEFNFPSKKAKKEFKKIVNVNDVNRHLATRSQPVDILFEQATENLNSIIRCQISNREKEAILDAYTPELSKKVRDIINAFQRRSGKKIDKKRLDAARHSQSAIKSLIVGYKQLYENIYKKENYIYRYFREKVNLWACMIIDLLCLEQQLSIALMVPHPAGSTKTFNTLYLALSLYELPLIEEEREFTSINETTSIENLYKRYQSLLIIDTKMLSPAQHKALYHFVTSHVFRIKQYPLSHGIDFDVPAWCCFYDRDQKPMLVDQKQEVNVGFRKHPHIYFFVQTFFDRIKGDYKTHLKSIYMIKKNQDRFMESLTVLSVLNLAASNASPVISYTSYQPINLIVSTGLQCFSDVNDVKNKKEQDTTTEKSRTQWSCAAEDDQYIHLQVDELSAGIIFDVGLPVLIDRLAEKELDNKDVAIILRLERIQKNKLNLVLVKLGNTSSIVTLYDINKKEYKGLIVKNGKMTYLITRHTPILDKKTVLKVEFSDKTCLMTYVTRLVSTSCYHQVAVLG